jgi:Glutaredoxin-like domain (DUF836)
MRCRMPDGRYPRGMDVIVYTRRGCPLCESGEVLARDVFGMDAVTLVDVDLDLELLEQYDDRVPVIATPDGTVIDEGIVRLSTLEEFVDG